MGSDVSFWESCIDVKYDQLLLLVCNRILKVDARMVRHNSAFLNVNRRWIGLTLPLT
mgnify:CR=1 FL=1|jgi:hypothetical protein